MQSFNVKYGEENKNYIELLTSFINTINIVNKPKVFSSFNLTNLLTRDEYNLLKEELLIKQIILLDILKSPQDKIDNEKIFVIDDDYCII